MGIFSSLLQKVQRHRDPAATGESEEPESEKMRRYIPRHPLARNLISLPSEIMCGSTAAYSM